MKTAALESASQELGALSQKNIIRHRDEKQIRETEREDTDNEKKNTDASTQFLPTPKVEHRLSRVRLR